MANYNKQFNFRNGVQVDDDNLVVSPTGLVGIGTTVPTELLDVRGDAKISGFATATELRGQSLVVSGISTFKEIKLQSDSIIVGSGVSIGSGIVTAPDPTGIVTYYGDARYLQGMPTSQWLDVDAGLGFISIYNVGNVGVGTDDPRFMLQIGGNTDTSVAGFAPGVGISSEGNVIATGIVTASSFVGIGSLLTLLNADELVSGTIDNDRLPEDIQITGIITANTFKGQQLNVTGLATASNFNGDLTGDVTGNLTGDAIVVSGIVTANTFKGQQLNVTGLATATTFNGQQLNVTGLATASSFIGNLEGDEIVITGIITATSLDGDVVGTASTALSLSGTPDIEVSNVISGIITGTRFEGDVIGTATTATDLTLNADIEIDRIIVGVSSVKSTLGIGTDPLTGSITVGLTTSGIGADILVDRFAGINTTTGGSASLRLLSDKEESVITIGSSVQLLGSNAQIRYANDSISFPYSTHNSLDFINYGDGNINCYLQSGAPGIGTGDFHWHNNDSVIMSLTYGGNLGLGITNPSQRLNVQGISTFSEDAFFSSDVFISGNLTISSLNVSSMNTNLFGNVTGDVVSSGISTFNIVSIGETATVERHLVIGNTGTVPSFIPFAVNPGVGQFFVDDSSNVGIGTSVIGEFFALDVNGAISGTKVSAGTTIPQSSIDFANAGAGTTHSFMIPPRVSDAERVGLGTVSGAFIYNTTSNKLQVYTGSSWETITSA
jgi:hypothetical protein